MFAAVNRRGEISAAATFAGVIAAVGICVATGQHVRTVVPGALGVSLLILVRRSLLQWRALIGAIVLVILFVPIRKYSLPGALPINLEPYRLLVALVAALWFASLLGDPRVRWSRSGLIDAPVTLFLIAVGLSLVMNLHRVESVASDALKGILFFLSYILVLYIVASLVRTAEDLDFQVKILVYGGAVVAFFCVVERWTHYNAFDHLSQVLPILKSSAGAVFLPDARGYRVIGSSQHPIAMGAALVMLAPLALYRAYSFGGAGGWIAAACIVLGAVGTISRTAILMLVVVAIVVVLLKGRYVKRAWPALVPMVFVIHFAAPGAIGTITSAFFPKGGLIAQQQNAAVGSGRLATLGPALHREFHNPLVGEGFATRVTTPDEVVPVPNGPILDDQWLGILLETGVVGTIAFLWIFVRFVKRVGAAARRDDSARGWFLCAVAASVAAYGASMFFYDALSFIQVTFVLFILLGLGSAGYRLDPRAWPTASARTVDVG